jgi:hypothetical protein
MLIKSLAELCYSGEKVVSVAVKAKTSTRPCNWRIIQWQYGYWLVCADPDTGQWYNEIPLATLDEVREVCKDYESTGYWIDCKEHYLSILRDLEFGKKGAREELKRFLSQGLPWLPREEARKLAQNQ